ncbi:MAG TPA: hypothetical protein VN516_01520 [Candidatus Baltobacteraceae bacterium]|nr:hypothetical protein [Candidatus Baltobacteraceae bacterium]
MKNQKWILFTVSLALIAGAAILLVQLKSHPRLGKPGIIATPIADDIKMKIDLPERVLDFASTNVPEPEVVLNYLPRDSSYAERRYRSGDDEIPIEGTIVMMGADRTSIHNADFCLRGQGLNPDAKSVVNIPIQSATPYELPVSRWNVSGTFQQPDGQKIKVNGVYVFWFVADGEQTPSHFEMMKKLATHLLHTGELQRWAYISYFTPCLPGNEDATFERMKKLIAASVPEFQLPPKSAGMTGIAPR